VHPKVQPFSDVCNLILNCILQALRTISISNLFKRICTIQAKKLNYDRKSKDSTYFAQLCVRNGKKATTKNIVRIGRHSELLKILDNPLAYAKEQVKKYNKKHKKF
jgi:hypothetical protein